VRRLVPLILILTACGASAIDVVDSSPTDSAITTTTSSTNSTAGVTEEVETTTTASSGRPVAPDFTLELGTGGVYTLSEGSKPVYMVFWAEW